MTWWGCACSCCPTTPVGHGARVQRRRRPGHAPVTADAGDGVSPIAVIEAIDDGAVRIDPVQPARGSQRLQLRALRRGDRRHHRRGRCRTTVHVVVLTGTGSRLQRRPGPEGDGPDSSRARRRPDAAKGFAGLLDAVQSFEKPLARGGERRRRGARVHASAALRSRVHGRRRPSARALRRAGCPPRGGQQLLVPAHHGVAACRSPAVHRRLDGAREAVDAGIALAHFPEASLLDETLAVAAAIAAAPIEAVMASKRLLLATRREHVIAARDREDAAFVELLGSAANLAALERFGTDSCTQGVEGVRGRGRMTGRPRSGPRGPVPGGRRRL